MRVGHEIRRTDGKEEEEEEEREREREKEQSSWGAPRQPSFLFLP